jgi:hypothetical protein
LTRHTALNALQARGLVRRLLKDAGLSTDAVTPQQLAIVGRELLGQALIKQGVDDVEGVQQRWLGTCTKLEERARSGQRTSIEDTVEEVLARMRQRR